MRYAEWTPTRAAVLRHYFRTILRRGLRPWWWLLHRVENAPALASWWERRSGPDYTGWRARARQDGGYHLRTGEDGVVTGYEMRGRRRIYTVAFKRTDVFTSLPAPEHVELIKPTP